MAALACCLDAASAADLTTTSVVGANSGWNTASIWKTNGTGTAVTGPVAGNTYQCVFNGVNWGNNLGNTRMRNLYATTSPSPQNFPGDSLTLNTNTEFRFKRIAAGNVPVVAFPGVGGSAGLILNGGVLNAGDDDTFTIAGKIRVDSESFICPGNNGGGGPTGAGRGFNITADISGTGNLALIQCSNYVAQTFAGNNEAYRGTLIVKSALLRGTGVNSLGTNCQIVIDPAYLFNLDASVIDYQGPAILEPMYDVNSAGTLTIRNGGQVRLHQNCAFTAVSIDGTPLSPGTHYYAQLAAAYPGAFPAGGSGSITVQPYGALPLVFRVQPVPEMALYEGRTASFTAVAAGQGTITYQWRKNGQNLDDGNNVSGTKTSTVTISNVSAADQASYDVVASNGASSSTSSSAALSVITPGAGAYETFVRALNPSVYYQLNETADPAVSAKAYDYVSGTVGTYGTGVQNGNTAYNVAGPSAAQGFPGFSANNKAAQFANMNAASRITLPAWNLNTNAVTITAWLNPTGPQVASAGLAFCRAGGTVAGFNYSPVMDTTGNFTLGYTWDNEGETWRWDSGLAPTAGQWSLVALVIAPDKATIYVINSAGEYESSRAYAHVPQSFAGTVLIGDDSAGANGARVFNGIIEDVAVFSAALSKADVVGLYGAAGGSTSFPARIAIQPVTQYLYRGQTAQFRVIAGGAEPLRYQWKAGAMGAGTYTNLTDGGRFSGCTTPELTIANATEADNADYIVTVQSGSSTPVTSSTATLIISAPLPPELITLSVQQPGGDNWDGTQWSDSYPASMSAAAKPGSTYELLGGARMRTPETNRTSVFPGGMLTLRGDSVWVNNPASTVTNVSEIRFKQPTPGRVNFPRLVMNGGQLDAGNDGVAEVGGRIDILTNAPIYNDGGGDRGFYIDAWLTGTGTIEYRGYNQSSFMSNYVNNLNIAGTSNTFSGKWNVVLGTLLATAPNCLGTNDVTVGANGAFEPAYDIYNTNGSLFLSGRMYLHQNHTFKSVFVNGAPLNTGTYTFAQLNASYPNNFPATWMPKTGATNFTAGSGNLTVLVQPAPIIVQQPGSVSVYPSQDVQFTVAAQGTPVLGYRWRKGSAFLTEGGNVSGVTNTTLSITNVTSANAGNYDVVVTNAIGSVTSIVATLTVLPTGPAQNLTLDFGGAPIVQPTGNDWNTVDQWSDGRPASVSALASPGSTYVVPAGARLRSPVNAASSVFPGDVLTVEGDGVFQEGSTTAGEIRFKHANPGSVYFKRLVLNGGMLDSGDNGIINIQGRVDVLGKTNSIYADSGAGTDRPWQIDAWLTGTGAIEYHAFNTSFAGNLNITGTSNTFSGIWNIVQGVLLGSGRNSLGTSDIIVGQTGAMETLYDINNYTGGLALDGQVFLHQNDTFKWVTIGGSPLAPGVYSFAQLNNAYPANFPGTWTQQMGSTVSSGSGSIRVLGDTPPDVTLQFKIVGNNLEFTWAAGSLLEADDLTGTWRVIATQSQSPYQVTPNPAVPRKFYKVQVQ